ncbi:NB-ARC domain-containing protein [Microcoleus vaginatus GB1-A2]|uniref:NB-ARC domain-containing protein n=1 Tax=Microcoleus vaginatus TaxID=119532 RepID=UPI001686BE33|nr:NACHT domain-containing protein [Microcoleus sp. FACHB-61]
MNVETALEIAEASFRAQTGKSPTDLQKDIFRKALEGKTYEQIAEDCNCNLSYVKELGSELWRLLSSALGKTVRKKSFKNVLEEYDHSSPTLPLPEKFPESAIAPSRQDWGEAPDVSVFYGRTEELTALKQWIVTDRCRLVALLGMGGIGKTSLSVKLAQKIQNDFDFIIWRSLDRTPPIHTVLKDIIRFICSQEETNLPETPSDAISRAIECLNAHRCLVIIDGVETIMETGLLAGKYRDGYQDYGRFFKKVGELNHKSCLVLTTSEKSIDISLLENRTRLVRSHKVSGLKNEPAQQILLERGLVKEKEWNDFIERYEGNPLALWMISATIITLFAGKTSDFLRTGTIFIGGQIEAVLSQMFERVTDLEIKVMCQLAILNKSVDFNQLRAEISSDISSSTLINALESLSWRSLIETEIGQDSFRLQPVIRKYVINHYCM